MVSKTHLSPLPDTNSNFCLSSHYTTSSLASSGRLPEHLSIMLYNKRKIDTTKAGTEQVSFGTPRMRVVVPGSDIQYSINAQGLYTFSVKLEETLS